MYSRAFWRRASRPSGLRGVVHTEAQGEDGLRPVPAAQGEEHVLPHQQVELVLGVQDRELLQSFGGVAFALPAHLDVRKLQPGLPLGGQAAHGEALPGAGQIRGGLVGRHPGGDEQHPIQPQAPAELLHNVQVPVVDGG